MVTMESIWIFRNLANWDNSQFTEFDRFYGICRPKPGLGLIQCLVGIIPSGLTQHRFALASTI
jgi:hypothetical protein